MPNYTKQELTKKMITWIAAHGKVPSIREWNDDPSTPSSMPYRKHWSSWGSAVKEVSGYSQIVELYGGEV